MQDSIFREYDIRGVVGQELRIEDVYALTRAIAYYFVTQNPAVRRVVVGMDGRVHSPIIVEQVCKALSDSGLDVIVIGICPSPVLYFALHTLDVHAGIMVTASHNPKEYNGMKICLGTVSVWGSKIRDIRALFHARKQIATDNRGTIAQQDIIPAYVDWFAQYFQHLMHCSLPVVVDCGNGTAGAVMPALIARMGWSQMTLLYPEVDGTYPNHEADPVKEENMADVKALLLQGNYAVGFGLDGDCDRMAAMTAQGYLIPGDQLLALFAKGVIAQNPGACVVMDIKSSSALVSLIATWGGQACFSPSGHAIIKDVMTKHQAILGGELSCHFFFADRYFGYDDGIYALARVLEIVAAGTSLEQLLSEYPRLCSTPEIRIACAEDQKHAIVEAVKQFFATQPDVVVVTIDGVRACFDYGWGIVRASNTQPALSMRFEADSPENVQRIQALFQKALQPYIDPKTIQNYCSQ